MSKFCGKNVFWGEFWLTVSDQDTETSQILYHSQTNTFADISRIFLGAMNSSLFPEWCTNQSGFPKKSQFRNYGTQARYLWRGIINQITEGNHIDDLIRTYLRLIPFSVWAEEVSKPQIFNYYDTIVKDVIMVIFKSNRTQTTLLK